MNKLILAINAALLLEQFVAVFVPNQYENARIIRYLAHAMAERMYTKTQQNHDL